MTILNNKKNKNNNKTRLKTSKKPGEATSVSQMLEFYPLLLQELPPPLTHLPGPALMGDSYVLHSFAPAPRFLPDSTIRSGRTSWATVTCYIALHPPGDFLRIQICADCMKVLQMRGSPVCICKQTYHMRTLKYAIVLSELAKEKE